MNKRSLKNRGKTAQILRCKLGTRLCHDARQVVRWGTVTRTTVHGSRAWLWPLQHGRASLHPFPLALSRLRLTSILPSIPLENYLSCPKPKVLLKAQIGRNISINESKESNLSISHIDFA